MTSKDVPHARRRDHHAELLQLTADAEIAPARVLSRETKDECDGIGIERVGRDLLRSRERPVPPNELAVPAQQGCRGDEKGGPTLARKKASECREHGAIGGGEPRTRDLAAKDRELMTQHRHLDVLLVEVWPDPNRYEQLSNEQGGHWRSHPTILPHLLRRWSGPRCYACTPHGSC